MKQNETLLVPKSTGIFICESCDYITSRESHFKRHVSTLKHTVSVDETLLKQKSTKKYQCLCGIDFGSRTTLWRHKKSCFITENTQHDDLLPESGINDKELILTLLQQNGQLQNQIIELCKSTNNTIITNNTNVNSNNKTFNLNVFLNETCKDAMNIMDFIDSIKLQLCDLENVGKLGYIEGISKIIVKNLKEMDVHKRPVHCSDSKREVMYIKDDNKWEKDNEEKTKLRKLIKRVAHKNSRLIPKYKEAHPDCDTTLSEQYNKLIIEAMGGLGDNLKEKEDKIIHRIAKEVTIDKINL